MYLKDQNISIIGAGLVGSLLSIYMSKIGAKTSVYERRGDIRNDINSSGRSINLSLSHRGMNALQEVGVKDDIMSIAMPMYKRIMHAVNGQITIQPYGQKDEAIFSVSRKELNILLMNLAEKNNVEFNFQSQCNSVDFKNTALKLSDKIIQSDFVFSTDGAGSLVRKQMQKEGFTDSSENFIEFGYKELTIPPDLNGKHKIENQSLHIWPRKSYMIIALPNLDGSFTCTLFFPLSGKNSFESFTNKLDLMNFFNKYFNDLVDLIPDIPSQYYINPTSSLGIVKCYPWIKNNIVLLGDACHATVPFYGQGMNSGFEDCFLLNNFIKTSKSIKDFKSMLPAFLQSRKNDTDAMQDLSMHNFVVMRDKTADNDFLIQKKIERMFSKKHPTRWLPLYSMVSFSNIPYSQALLIGKRQSKIMEHIMSQRNIENMSDSELENLILSMIDQ